jgi:tripartite-type tricarboxylate transporter receptor subunit TctC
MSSSFASRRDFLRHCTALAAAFAGGAGGTGALAQAPADQLRILVGFPAGSFPDSLARVVAEQLSSAYPKRALVENRPGAAGLIAVNALKASPADGSSVLLAPGAVASAYPYLYEKLAYDPAVDLKPVTVAAEVTLALAVGPAVAATVSDVRGLAEWMRANPKLANVASPGIGTPPHLLEAMLFRRADVSWQHVAYPGGPPGIAALLGGQVSALVLPEGSLRAHRDAGRLRVLATTGTQRSRYLPDVPTLIEQGFAGLSVIDWFAFFMPGPASASVVESTSQKLRAALLRPEVVAAYAEAAAVVAPSTPAAMASRIAEEQAYWKVAIREHNIRLDS